MLYYITFHWPFVAFIANLIAHFIFTYLHYLVVECLKKARAHYIPVREKIFVQATGFVFVMIHIYFTFVTNQQYIQAMDHFIDMNANMTDANAVNCILKSFQVDKSTHNSNQFIATEIYTYGKYGIENKIFHKAENIPNKIIGAVTKCWIDSDYMYSGPYEYTPYKVMYTFDICAEVIFMCIVVFNIASLMTVASEYYGRDISSDELDVNTYIYHTMNDLHHVTTTLLATNPAAKQWYIDNFENYVRLRKKINPRQAQINIEPRIPIKANINANVKANDKPEEKEEKKEEKKDGKKEELLIVKKKEMPKIEDEKEELLIVKKKEVLEIEPRIPIKSNDKSEELIAKLGEIPMRQFVSELHPVEHVIGKMEQAIIKQGGHILTYTTSVRKNKANIHVTYTMKRSGEFTDDSDDDDSDDDDGNVGASADTGQITNGASAGNTDA